VTVEWRVRYAFAAASPEGDHDNLDRQLRNDAKVAGI
jgi:hypothetical protein